MSSAFLTILQTILSCRSLMKILNKIGPRTVSCGTPLINFNQSDSKLFTLTQSNLSLRRLLIMFLAEPVKPKVSSFAKNFSWSMNQTLLVNQGKPMLYCLFYQVCIVLFPSNIPVRQTWNNFSGIQIAFCCRYLLCEDILQVAP